MKYETNLELHDALQETAKLVKEHVDKNPHPKDHLVEIDVALPHPTR